VSAAEGVASLPPVPGLPGALPPPPLPGANYFNLQMSSGGIGPSIPFYLPPPPLPTGPIPGAYSPFSAPPSASTSSASSSATSSTAVEPPIPGTERPIPVYYPSQDPTRMGAVQLKPTE